MLRATLSGRIALVVILIIGLGVGLTVLLNYFKLAQTLAAVSETRLGFLAHDLRSRIESGLDLGLDLGAMDNVQSIIEGAAAGDAKILAITVFDADGTVLYGAGSQAVEPGAGQVPAPWREAAERHADWRVDSPGVLVVGSRLTNDFGAAAGGVALVYSRAALDLLLKGVLAVLVPVGAVLVLAAVLLAWLAAAALFRGTERRLRDMRQAVEGLLVSTEQPGTEAAATAPVPADPDLTRMRERLVQTLEQIREAGTKLAALASGRA